MALHNTVFTALTSGTRDNSSEDGAVYYLDGNSTNGRTNISQGATLRLGHNTTMVTDGNAVHSYMNGTIEADALTIVSIAPSGGRVDPINQYGSFKTNDLTLVAMGEGSVFTLLEDRNNLSVLTGYTRLISNMSSSGTVYYQFNSKEYPGVSIDVKPTHQGGVVIYPARSFAGFTSLSGLTINGLSDSDEITFFKGSESTSHGRIYDPNYIGITNNLLKLKTNSGVASSNGKEYFTLDLDNIPDTARIEVKNGSTVQHNKVASPDNCKIFAYDGTTALVYYEGKKVVECLVRTFSNTVSSTRNSISYLIRNAGKKEIKVNDLVMNSPVVVPEMLDDEHYSSTSDTITEINTIAELYDLIEQAKANDLTLPSDLFNASGKIRQIKTGYSLVRDQALTGSPVQITSSQIKVKTGSNGLKKDSTADTLTGTVDSSFNDHTDMQYVKSTGKVSVNLNLTTETGVTSSVWGVWDSSQGTNDRTGILTATADKSIDLTPGDSMYYIADAVNAYRGQPTLFTVGDYGNSVSQELVKIKKADGSNIVPDTLSTEQQRIADTIVYSHADARVDLKLPDDYSTDSRWDSTNKVWKYTAEDFKPFAYKAEQIQSSQNSLNDPTTVRVEDYKFVLEQSSDLIFRQHVDNVDCEMNIEAWTTVRQGGGNKKFYDDSNGALTFSKGNPVIASVDGGFSNDSETKLSNISIAADKLNFDSNNKLLVNVLQTDFDTLVSSVNNAIKDTYKGSGGSSGITQSDFSTFMAGVPESTKNSYKASSMTTNEIVDAILNAPYGTLTDGMSPLGNGTLGQHWFQFYPPEIIRQLLETALNGTTQITRFQTTPGTYGDGTLGDALRKILTRATKEEIADLNATGF